MRIIIIDEKGWLKLPPTTEYNNEVVEKVRRRYGDDANFLIELAILLVVYSDKVKTITVELNDDREYTLAVE